MFRLKCIALLPDGTPNSSDMLESLAEFQTLQRRALCVFIWVRTIAVATRFRSFYFQFGFGARPGSPAVGWERVVGCGPPCASSSAGNSRSVAKIIKVPTFS